MKKVNCSLWALVSEGQIIELDAPDGLLTLVTESKRVANDWLKMLKKDHPDVETRIARLKVTEPVPKVKKDGK